MSRCAFVLLLAMSCCGFAHAGPAAHFTNFESLDFGTQLIGTASAPRSATIKNTGDVDLTIQAAIGACCAPPRDNAAFALAGTCLGSPLPPGQSCTLSLTFTPHFPDGNNAFLSLFTQPYANVGVTAALVFGVGLTQAPFAHAQSTPSYSTPVPTSFGTQSVGLRSPAQTRAITNFGLEPLVVSGVRVTGESGTDFAAEGCAPGIILRTLESCAFAITFDPSAPGERTATVVVDSNAPAGNAVFAVRGEGIAAMSPGKVAIDATTFDFGTVASEPSDRRETYLRNIGGSAYAITAVRIVGPHAADFYTTAYDFSSLGSYFAAAGAQLYFSASFSPLGPGRREAQLQIDTTVGRVTVDLVGQRSAAWFNVPVRQYYNASLDHYFLALMGPESLELDNGIKAGWKYVGSPFYARVPGSSYTSTYLPVCRFYIPPGYGDSHFFSASAAECQETARKFPHLVLESPSVFYVYTLPDPSAADLRANGGCPWGIGPVYRLWNNRSDSNHVYTNNLAERAKYIAKGYVPEGDGVDGAVMCQ